MRTRTAARSVLLAMRRVASMPSSPGICTSISTTSGRRCRESSTAEAPSVASPTTFRSSSASRAGPGIRPASAPGRRRARRPSIRPPSAVRAAATSSRAGRSPVQRQVLGEHPCSPPLRARAGRPRNRRRGRPAPAMPVTAVTAAGRRRRSASGRRRADGAQSSVDLDRRRGVVPAPTEGDGRGRSPVACSGGVGQGLLHDAVAVRDVDALGRQRVGECRGRSARR